MNWRDAFFTQAWSDYQLLRGLNESRYPLCHKLHYLQMTTEKLAKGFLCHFQGRNAPAQKTHFVFTRFLKISKQRSGLRESLGYERNSKAFSHYVDSLLPMAQKIERLAPMGRLSDQINTEYPWLQENGEVTCPASYDFPDFNKKDLAEVYRFLSRLFYSLGFHLAP
jgi:hypothetical protein